VVLDRAAHLAPAEAPADTARVILETAGIDAGPVTLAHRSAAGMVVRRAVPGDEHVERATAAATDLTSEFQEFITAYA
jgi:3-oxoadipate enol-lactonase/4-carboxymuconolactone decarboxylase